ncbi:uncharacterized protein N0V96_006664 [Colletotrichum fioriniae]|uniref:uncharacterized protein n=1 Tax=Colletotrichum fioriniae TaxID=710243 RepID=UPI0032DBB352|nr:hypothetical protein N0V96_006664 [Colletotrichum fioriniae]
MRLLTTLALAATSASAASLTLSIPSSQALPNPLHPPALDARDALLPRRHLLRALVEGGLAAWETYRGNDWDNKGEAYAAKDFEGGGKGFEVRVLGQKNYFVERSKFSILTILKNPMILLGLISMGIFLGMPYLMDNMDPEMRAEFEERQKSNPMNSLLGGGGGGGDANPMANFDMAGFLAGTGSSSSKKEETSGSGASGGGAGGKKEKGVRR